MYVIVKDGMDGLRKAFIRTVFDLLAAETNSDLDKVARLSQIEEDQLSAICDIMKGDPKISVLNDIRGRLSKL